MLFFSKFTENFGLRTHSGHQDNYDVIIIGAGIVGAMIARELSKYNGRCEQVTEAEVLEAIYRGADTMDAVKHTTRAGMGRCQGGFCGISVLNYLAGTLGVIPTRVTKKGLGSNQISESKKRSKSLCRSYPKPCKRLF